MNSFWENKVKLKKKYILKSFFCVFSLFYMNRFMRFFFNFCREVRFFFIEMIPVTYSLICSKILRQYSWASLRYRDEGVASYQFFKRPFFQKDKIHNSTYTSKPIDRTPVNNNRLRTT